MNQETQAKWESLYGEANTYLEQAAIVTATIPLVQNWDDVPMLHTARELENLVTHLFMRGRELAALLVHCTRCGATPTVRCTARRAHMVRVKRAEFKGFVPEMTVHVHAANREYRGAVEVGQ
jgi:hypothetical protein